MKLDEPDATLEKSALSCLAQKAVMEKYQPGNAEGQQGLHYYKGQIGRFRQSYSAEEQEILAARLGSYLSKMGYAV